MSEPTAKELLNRYNWLDAQELAARVEKVLEELNGVKVMHDKYRLLAILNGEEP